MVVVAQDLIKFMLIFKLKNKKTNWSHFMVAVDLLRI